MAIGRMREKADIIRLVQSKDSMGFTSEVEEIVCSIRCEKEGRHGSEKWANLSTFSDATDLFRFRKNPKVTITTEMYIRYEGQRLDILSIEDIKGRNMYLEVQAKVSEPSSGKM